MSLKIRRAVVLGSGVMGAQIAAHLAAAGVRTHLLDLVSDKAPADPKLKRVVGKNVRSSRAILALEQLKQLKPPPLASESILPNIIPGNFEDDWSVLADADWVIEAVVERLDIKKQIHKRISEAVKPHIPVTTNTSGISLREICADLSEHYASQFFGTHFFNPPRYMHLVEVIAHDLTNLELLKDLSDWISRRLGKGIVEACDTINFIANRVGVLSIQSSLRHMAELKLNIETVDALTGPLIGHPKSATMRTMDVVGLDTFMHVAKNVYDAVPDDPYHEFFAMPQWIQKLVESGHTGQKAGNIGCYKKSKDEKGKTAILAYRPEKGCYEPQTPQEFDWLSKAAKTPNFFERMNFIFSQKDAGAEFLWRIHRDVFSYSALLLEQIAKGQPKSLDEAMRWGFNWQWGPFEIWQGTGYNEILERMRADNTKLPDWIKNDLSFYEPSPNSIAWQTSGAVEQLRIPEVQPVKIAQPDFKLHLPKFQNPEEPRNVLTNRSGSLLDLGDGVACLVFHSKMNTINDELIELTQQSVAKVTDDFDGLIIGNDGDHFSAGANLKSIVEFIEQKAFDKIDAMIRGFQGALQLIKFAPFPSVSCPHGLTLGGGCEVSLHTSRTLLANDTFAGLVEVGVGLVPAGGGTKELALRAYNLMNLAERGDPSAFIQRAFMLIGMGQVSNSGLHAIEMGVYPQTAQVSISKERQVLRAKAMVQELIDLGYAPPIPAQGISVLGDPGIQTIKLMLYNMQEGRQISPYDAYLGEQIATILCGGEVDSGTKLSEQQFLDLERRVFVDLCRQEKTKERIVHMLKTGKPLRN